MIYFNYVLTVYTKGIHNANFISHAAKDQDCTGPSAPTFIG